MPVILISDLPGGMNASTQDISNTVIVKHQPPAPERRSGGVDPTLVNQVQQREWITRCQAPEGRVGYDWLLTSLFWSDSAWG